MQVDRKIRRWLLVITMVIAVSIFTIGCEAFAVEEKQLNLHFISTLRGHPVVRITSAGFYKACMDMGYNGKLLAPEGHDVEALIRYFEQAIVENSDGILSWSTAVEAFYPVIKKARAAGIPVIEVHCILPEPVANAYVGPDQAKAAYEVADWMIQKLTIERGITEGKIAITQGSFNDTENYWAEKFTERINEKYPQFEVLEPVEEGFDVAVAIQRAVSILLAHPNVVGAYSTTGGGPVTWGKAKDEAGREDVVAIGMDTTPMAMEMLLKDKVEGLVCQSLFEESYRAVELIRDIYAGKKVKYWNYIESSLGYVVSKDNVDYWIEQNKFVEEIHEEMGT